MLGCAGQCPSGGRVGGVEGLQEQQGQGWAISVCTGEREVGQGALEMVQEGAGHQCPWQGDGQETPGTAGMICQCLYGQGGDSGGYGDSKIGGRSSMPKCEGWGRIRRLQDWWGQSQATSAHTVEGD